MTLPFPGSSVKRVLVIRPTAMGDVVMASVLLPGLKRLFPGAEIHWLVDPGLAPLLAHNRAVAGVIPWDRRAWRSWLVGGRWARLVRSARELRRELRRRPYHLALECQGLLRSRLLCYLSGARFKLGFRSKEPGGLLMDRLVSRGPHSTLFASEYLYLLDLLGYEGPPPRPCLEVGPGAREGAARLLSRMGITGGYAALAPFTTRPQKHWLPDRWADLMKGLHRLMGLQPVVLGGPADQEAALALVERAGVGATLAGQAGVAESAAVVQGAQVVIGVDTGLVHMGTAFQRPTVALFGATRPYLELPLPAPTRIVYHPMECSPCRRRPSCRGGFPCMEAITVEEVMEAARQALEQRGAP